MSQPEKQAINEGTNVPGDVAHAFPIFVETIFVLFAALLLAHMLGIIGEFWGIAFLEGALHLERIATGLQKIVPYLMHETVPALVPLTAVTFASGAFVLWKRTIQTLLRLVALSMVVVPLLVVIGHELRPDLTTAYQEGTQDWYSFQNWLDQQGGEFRKGADYGMSSAYNLISGCAEPGTPRPPLFGLPVVHRDWKLFIPTDYEWGCSVARDKFKEIIKRCPADENYRQGYVAACKQTRHGLESFLCGCAASLDDGFR